MDVLKLMRLLCQAILIMMLTDQIWASARKTRIRHEEDLLKLELGDLVEIERGVYSHWAVYVGRGFVVHLTGIGPGRLPSEPQHSFTISGVEYDKAQVKKDHLFVVSGDSRAYKNNKYDNEISPLPKTDIDKETHKKIGTVGYNLITQNCEHFATNCRYGKPMSEQTSSWMQTFGVGIGVGIAIIAVLGILFCLKKKEITNITTYNQYNIVNYPQEREGTGENKLQRKGIWDTSSRVENIGEDVSVKSLRHVKEFSDVKTFGRHAKAFGRPRRRYMECSDDEIMKL